MSMKSCWAGMSIFLVLVALGLTSCGGGGLGTISPVLVDLYDCAAPDGLIEIEINRDGTIREMEADIPVMDLPENVRDVAMAKAPGAVITGAEREIVAGSEAWEVKFRYQGRDWEYVIDSQGTILETEKELKRSEAPPAVLQGAEEALPGGKFKSIEVITIGQMEEYHVKKTFDGVSYKIVLTPAGEVKRKVREARAEIEIPLK